MNQIRYFFLFILLFFVFFFALKIEYSQFTADLLSIKKTIFIIFFGFPHQFIHCLVTVHYKKNIFLFHYIIPLFYNFLCEKFVLFNESVSCTVRSTSDVIRNGKRKQGAKTCKEKSCESAEKVIIEL